MGSEICYLLTISSKSMLIRGCQKFGIKVCILKATVSGVFEDLKSLKFQKARSKIEVVLTLP